MFFKLLMTKMREPFFQVMLSTKFINVSGAKKDFMSVASCLCYTVRQKNKETEILIGFIERLIA